MATKTPKTPKTPKEPKTPKVTKPRTKKPKVETFDEGTITIGSHSTRTEFANGKVLFVHDDDKLRKDVMAVLEAYALGK